MENSIKMDDLGVPLFLETPIWPYIFYISGQIIATSHDLGPQNLAEQGKSPYFREIHVGEIL